ncbi:MAG: dihydroorotase, partial [Thermodesulfobacteriota bacterium]|nr:dihydroorotase [Thermodesulfobacteriota bacterium]
MSKPNLVIRNALWRGKKRALLVSKGKVLELKPAGEAIKLNGAEVMDAEGLLLLPSLTDAHVHLREPGYEYKEDIASGLKAAAFGGFGQVMAMANTNPVNDNATVTELMLAQVHASWPKGPKLLPVGALSKGLECRELAPMAELAQAGCVAVSNDGLPVQSTEFFRRAVEYASNFGLKVIDHCEDPSMGLGLGINEGRVSSLLGLKGQPSVAESLHVARDILLAAYLDLPIHLAHISCRESVELIHAAKAKGIPVTAETCPHYLVFTEKDVDGYNTAAKVNPPLRTPDDVLALQQGLREGVIDILVTDHAPHADFEKEVPFA